MLNPLSSLVPGGGSSSSSSSRAGTASAAAEAKASAEQQESASSPDDAAGGRRGAFPSPFDLLNMDNLLRGGASTGDHVDILGNFDMIGDILKIAGRHRETGESIPVSQRVISNIIEIAQRVDMDSVLRAARPAEATPPA